MSTYKTHRINYQLPTINKPEALKTNFNFIYILKGENMFDDFKIDVVGGRIILKGRKKPQKN